MRLEELVVSFKCLGGHPDLLAGNRFSEKILAESIAAHRIMTRENPFASWQL
jgi:hypothetical protein